MNVIRVRLKEDADFSSLFGLLAGETSERCPVGREFNLVIQEHSPSMIAGVVVDDHLRERVQRGPDSAEEYPIMIVVTPGTLEDYVPLEAKCEISLGGDGQLEDRYTLVRQQRNLFCTRARAQKAWLS